MKPKVCFLLLVGMLVFVSSANLSLADDPGNPDTCRVQCGDLTLPGQQVVIGVDVYNDEDLGGLVVPLTFGHSGLDLVCDSVSFVGGRAEHAEYRGVSVDTAGFKLLFYAVFIDSHMVAGDGAVAQLYFSTGPTWDSTLCVHIDTAFYPPTTVLEFTPRSSGQALHPEFSKGCLASGTSPMPGLIEPLNQAMLCSPDTFDFVWSGAGDDLSYTLEYAQDSAFTVGVMTYGGLADTSSHVSLPRGTYFWHVSSRNSCYAESPYQEPPFTFSVYRSGDATADGQVLLSDAIKILNYLYKNGPAPDPLQSGDANADDIVDIGDAISLLNYLFKNGVPPRCPYLWSYSENAKAEAAGKTFASAFFFGGIGRIGSAGTRKCSGSCLLLHGTARFERRDAPDWG
jgi:hypothetical protein